MIDNGTWVKPITPRLKKMPTAPAIPRDEKWDT
jgi:hypothetical protein